MKKFKKKKIIIFGITLFIIILFLISFFIFFKSISNENTSVSKFTKSYKIINVSFAKKLIENYPDITVIDCSGGCQECTWKNGSHLPYAQWIESPKLLYNHALDILVYCQSGLKSIDFCEKLVNHVYGNIYCLQGGYIAWKKEI